MGIPADLLLGGGACGKGQVQGCGLGGPSPSQLLCPVFVLSTTSGAASSARPPTCCPVLELADHGLNPLRL